MTLAHPGLNRPFPEAISRLAARATVAVALIEPALEDSPVSLEEAVEAVGLDFLVSACQLVQLLDVVSGSDAEEATRRIGEDEPPE